MLDSVSSPLTALLSMPKNNVLKFPSDPFILLINQHRAELNRFIARKIGTNEMSEDILQDAYLRLQQYSSITTIDNPRAFVFRIVANLVIDYQRNANQRLPHDNDEDVLHNITDNAAQPDEQYLAVQRLEMINAALAELPDKCRTAFYLHRIEGRSHAEIAEQLHISTSMVAKHLFKAMIHCRERLKNQ